MEVWPRMQHKDIFRVSIFLSSNKLPLNLGGERGILIQVEHNLLLVDKPHESIHSSDGSRDSTVPSQEPSLNILANWPLVLLTTLEA